MNTNKTYLAIDLGATSGRTIVGKIAEGKVELTELTRFDNHLIQTGGHAYWDIFALYREIVSAMKLVVQRGIEIESIGIDTWGCDFVCIGADTNILRNPLAYRDPHTVGVKEDYFDHVLDKETVYEKTGIQFMNFNSLFQLYAMSKHHDSAFENAKRFLFIPDALSYMLTGQAICEYTVASTSQILNPTTGDLDNELVESIGLTRDHFGKLTQPGTIIGSLTTELQQITGLVNIPVVAVAGHDTASAVAAVPAKDQRFAYLSSGTWSLMGIETPRHIIDQRSYSLNFTNEGGIEGTTRYLKNICGMWLYEQCRREWAHTHEISHKELQASAMNSEPFRSIIFPDDASFANPVSMTKAIDAYCQKTGQPVPETPADYCRCIFDSLTLRYKQVFSYLREAAGFDIEVLHIIGGGSKNAYLNQFTANACNITVLAGPEEGTALGNIMLQAKACGEVKDRWAMREIIRNSIALKTFEPQDQDVWNKAYEKYLALTEHVE